MCAGHGRYNRTTDAWRTIDENETNAMFLCHCPRLIAHHGNQFARVVLAGEKLRVHEVTRILVSANITGTSEGRGKINSASGTQDVAGSAALTGMMIDRKFLRNSIKSTYFTAFTATGAPRGIDGCLFSSNKLLFFKDNRIEDHMEVSGVNIAVRRHPVGQETR
jgi:hypothetical protein